MKTRLVSLFLCLCMLITIFPTTAYAAQGDSLSTTAQTTYEKTENPFTDVKKTDWFYSAVLYALENGIFLGTSKTTFEPNGTMTRSMFVTVLGRMAGVDTADYKGKSAFSDVAADAYYAPFVAWAAKHGITLGDGKGKFTPDELINRQQMAVFFVRYFETFGVDYETGAKITTTPADIDKVADYAKAAVLKLWKTGLLAGDGVNFNPLGNASRAQAATLCMRTDKVVETWYREPGVPSDKASVDPGAEQKPQTPGSSTDGSTDGSTGGSTGGSTTTYYKVTFVIDSKSEEKVYPKDTLLSTLPIPTLTGKVFLGWYHDAGKTNPVAGDEKLTANTTLYAKLTDAVALDEGGAPNFVSALDQVSGFFIPVKKTDGEPILGTDFKFRNITAPDKTPETKSAAEDEMNTETVKVEGSGGVWTISSARGGFTPGHTYQIELISDAVIYDDSAAAFEDFKAAHGQENIAQVRFFNFSIEKDGTLNLKLNDDIKFIGVDKLNPADGASLMEYAGLYLASTDEQGNTTYTANEGSGSFTYTGSDIKVGDIVSIYTGTKPTERKPEKGTANKTNNEDVSYVKITVIDGSTYYYVAAEAEEVIFKPDVLPIDVDASEKTGWTKSGTSVVINNDKLNFATGYEKMGLSAETTVDKGDYLAFYTGDFGQDDAKDQAYGEIINVAVNGDTTIITYKEVSENQVMSAMDMYDETQLTEAEIQAAINESKDEIQQIIEAQLMESDFFDDAGEYLAGLALQTDEVREVFGNGMTLSDCTITYADGTPLGSSDLALMGNIIDKEQDGRKPKASVSISTKLSHFDQTIIGPGLRVEVVVTYAFKIQKKGSSTVMEVNLNAFFEQELTIGFSVSGGAVWKWKWIFPYIADFRMNGNLDIGTYTGIGITATAKLSQDEPEGMDWPKRVQEAAKERKIINLSESIKEKMELVNMVLPESEASASGGLAEKYAAFMDDANEDWVDLITVKLIDLHGAVDPLHILAYGLQVDFVVSANLNVAIGMTFQYENLKRHSFTLSLNSKKADSETVDISTNGYQFDFYVMGSIGMRAGIQAKATVGLFSTKLAGIGLQIDVGAYARLWGYFYYHLENWKIDGKWQKESSYSGAAFIEVGVYLDLNFIAEVLNGKYSYAPTIYAKEWPFWSAGQRENVYDFAYKHGPTYNILNVNTYTIPSVVYDMLWMDLTTGKMEESNIKNYDSDTATGSDDELRFAVELSNANFTYDPTTNQITIDTVTVERAQSCEMTITWKNAPLAGSSEVISRTITLNWSTDINKSVITFESNGGSAVDMLVMLADTDISQKMPQAPKRTGYIFSGWYTERDCLNEFKATTMPEGPTTLYAKWVPDRVLYTVEHYRKELDGKYVLLKTDRLRGYTGDLTSAAPVSYAGFTAQQPKQQTIAPEGSTRILIYYDRNSYELKFVLYEDNDITINMPYGSTIVPPSYPYKQGYTFAGWDKIVRSTMPDSALTYTAQWAPSTDTYYRVKHYTENLDGTFALAETEGKSGTTGRSTNATNKTFTGFTVKKPITQKTILPDGSTVVEIYYDRNSHLLSWNFNGGEVPAGTSYTYGTVKYGTTIVMPTLTRTGYAFSGWYTNSGLTNRYYPTTMPDAPLTLYAKWVEGQTTYTVKHIRQAYDGTFPESGELVETQTLYGKTGDFTNATARSYTGYRKPNVYNNQTIAADGSTVVELKYNAYSYTVYFGGNGPDRGNTLSQTFLHGDPSGLHANGYEKANHAFTSWNTRENGTGIGYADGAPVMDLVSRMDSSLTLTLYAQWKFDHVIVSFYSNPGNGSSTPTTAASIKVPYLGTYGTLPVVSRAGYTFAGWYTNTNYLTLITSGTKVTSTSDHMLYAAWRANNYKVDFNENEGSGTMAAQTFYYDDPVEYLTPNAFTRPGYTFNGWNTKADGSGKSYANRAAVRNLTGTANDVVTLYAQWKANTYTVKFNANLGSGTMEDQTFLYGETKALTANTFTRAFYAFNGWNTKADGSGIPYANTAAVSNLTDTPNGIVTLYAQWKVDATTVTFNSNKGSGSSQPTAAKSILVNYSEAYGTLPTVSRSGYTFDGWYTEASGGTEVTETTKVENAGDHVLYAHWTAHSYTVVFNGNGNDGGSMEGHLTFTYDVEQTLTPNVFTRTGHTFDGWNTKENGFGTAYKDKATVKNLTGEANGSVILYAQWTDNSNAVQIGTEVYPTLQAGIEAAKNGETIQMLRDIKENVEIPSWHPRSFTLDLNGKTLDGGERRAITKLGLPHSGVITITDTAGGGKITSADPDPTRGTIAWAININSGLNIQGGTIENTHENGNAIYNNGYGNINISGGTVEASGGIAINNIERGAVNISGGTVRSKSIAIYNKYDAPLNISGGTVSSTNGNAIVGETYGKITISGTATVVSEASFEDAPLSNSTILLKGSQNELRITDNATVANARGSAILSMGSKIYISGTAMVTSANPSDKRGTITFDMSYGNILANVLEITGGTVENTDANGTAVYYTTDVGRTTIPKGSFVVIKGGGMAINKAPDLTYYQKVQITASTDVSGVPEVPYVKADIQTYKYLKFEQGPGNTNVAIIEATGTEYATLQEAFDEVADGQTIKFMDNIIFTGYISIPDGTTKSFTLDLNDYTLYGYSTGGGLISHSGSGTITITDSSVNGGGRIINEADWGQTIALNSGNLVIAGGTVENLETQSVSSPATIVNNGSGSITITGGQVLGRSNVILNGTGSVDISGGMVRNTGTGRVIYSSGGKVTISGTAMLTSTYGGGSFTGAIEFYKVSDTPITILEIKGGTIDNNGSANAIYIRQTDFLAVSISSGPSVIKSGGSAINVAPHVEEGVKVTASTDYDGTTTVDYVQTQINNYKYLRFE